MRVSNEALAGLYYNIFLKRKSVARVLDLAFADHRLQKGLEMDICIWVLPS